MKLPPKPKASDPAWVRKEKARKRREAQEARRISSDHELTGERHRQPHRDKDIPLEWKYENGSFHVSPVRIVTGGGLNISDEDWEEIWRDKSTDSVSSAMSENKST